MAISLVHNELTKHRLSSKALSSWSLVPCRVHRVATTIPLTSPSPLGKLRSPRARTIGSTPHIRPRHVQQGRTALHRAPRRVSPRPRNPRPRPDAVTAGYRAVRSASGTGGCRCRASSGERCRPSPSTHREPRQRRRRAGTHPAALADAPALVAPAARTARRARGRGGIHRQSHRDMDRPGGDRVRHRPLRPSVPRRGRQRVPRVRGQRHRNGGHCPGAGRGHHLRDARAGGERTRCRGLVGHRARNHAAPRAEVRRGRGGHARGGREHAGRAKGRSTADRHQRRGGTEVCARRRGRGGVRSRRGHGSTPHPGRCLPRPRTAPSIRVNGHRRGTLGFHGPHRRDGLGHRCRRAARRARRALGRGGRSHLAEAALGGSPQHWPAHRGLRPRVPHVRHGLRGRRTRRPGNRRGRDGPPARNPPHPPPAGGERRGHGALVAPRLRRHHPRGHHQPSTAGVAVPAHGRGHGHRPWARGDLPRAGRIPRRRRKRTYTSRPSPAIHPSRAPRSRGRRSPCVPGRPGGRPSP